MGLGPQVIALYIQLKINGTFDGITRVLELGSQDIMFRGKQVLGNYNSLMVKLFETFNCVVPSDADLERMVQGPAKDVYEYLGLKYNCLDVNEKYNSLVFDINFDEVSSEHKNKYDLVTNHGTTEHLINQFNGFKISHDFTRPGGLMLHVLPFTGYLDHGFFNYQPNLFTSLASYNSYEILGMWINIDSHLSSMIPWQDKLLDYITLSPSCNSCLAVLMKKKNDSEFSVPFQSVFESTRIDEISSRYSFSTDAELYKNEKDGVLTIQHLQNTRGKLLAKELVKRLKARIGRLFKG